MRLLVATVALFALGLDGSSALAKSCKNRCETSCVHRGCRSHGCRHIDCCNPCPVAASPAPAQAQKPAPQPAPPAPQWKEVEITRKVPKLVKKEIEVVVHKPEWKDETRVVKTLVPTMVKEQRQRTICKTEWKDEVRERMICVPTTKMVEKEQVVRVPKMVAETCMKERVTCRKVYTGCDCCGRPCYERVREVCQVPVTVNRRVWTTETRKVTCPVTTYAQKPEKVTVRVCHLVPVVEKFEVEVCKLVEQEKKVPVRTCNLVPVKEKRVVEVCEWVEEKSKVKVCVSDCCAATCRERSCRSDCCSGHRGLKLFSRSRCRDCGGCY
jgi:hypothetical protein